MKKSVKIILIIASILLVIALVFGYMVYREVKGSEKITGKLDGIPSPSGKIPAITQGLSDWPNWRGVHFDGKSDTKNINKDWSKGLKKLWQVDYLCHGSVSATWSAPVVQGNRLIITGRDEKNDYVFCLNAESGELIWQGAYTTEA